MLDSLQKNKTLILLKLQDFDEIVDTNIPDNNFLMIFCSKYFIKRKCKRHFFQ